MMNKYVNFCYADIQQLNRNKLQPFKVLRLKMLSQKNKLLFCKLASPSQVTQPTKCTQLLCIAKLGQGSDVGKCRKDPI